MKELDTKFADELERDRTQAVNDYQKGNYEQAIKVLEEAWEKLPKPKGVWRESFHIALYISQIALKINDIEKAKKWSKEIFNCGLDRADDGEREYLAGKVAYESGEKQKAKDWFKLADYKSEGRCFTPSESKYLKFYKE